MTRLRSPEQTASFGAASPPTDSQQHSGSFGGRSSPAFDAHHPPDRALIDTCVHCGFCLPTCPTYVLWGEEMDSPRGRIYLMKSGVDGRTAMNGTFVRHFDACLGCMACVTACPSGVQYAPLIEATRGQIERRYTRSVADRLFRRAIFALFPYPARLRLALMPLLVVQRLIRGPEGTGPHKLAAAEQQRVVARPFQGRGSGLLERLRSAVMLAPRITWRTLTARVPAHTPAVGERRMTVGLLTGCVQRVMFPNVNAATLNVLAAEGCDVVAPADQGCCGALALHAGRFDDALEFARRTIATFERARVDTIVVNAAGCGSSMKEYGQLLADDAAWAERARAFSARVRDVTEFVAELGSPRAVRQAIPMRVAYQDACHLAHAQDVRQQPRDVLRSIPGVDVVPLAEPDLCCGSAGIFNLVEPDTAQQLGDRKIAHIAAVKPDAIATANPGCMLQLRAAAARRGYTIPIFHPIELLDRAIRRDT